MKLDFSSNYLVFLSLQTVHWMHCANILHQFFWLLLPPLLIQRLNKSTVCLGMVHFVSVRLRKIVHICVVYLQCKERCLSASLHSMHLDTIFNPFLFNTSYVKQDLQATNHVTHFTFVDARFFQVFLHTFWQSLAWTFLCYKPCLQLISHPNCVSTSKIKLATLSTFQSFNNFQKDKFHPCGVQHWFAVSSGLFQR